MIWSVAGYCGKFVTILIVYPNEGFERLARKRLLRSLCVDLGVLSRAFCLARFYPCQSRRSLLSRVENCKPG